MNKHHFYSMLCGASAVLMCACSENVSGRWEGACRNDTFGVEATLSLLLNESNGSIRGALTIGGDDLGGSGEISGVISGKNISFTSPGDGQMATHITWTGIIDGDTISGTYRVEPTALASSMDVPVQTGRFVVTKK